MDKNSLHLNELYYLDSRGRYRDKKTHRYVKKEIIGKLQNAEVSQNEIQEKIPLSSLAKEATRKHLLEAVQEEGIDAENPMEAWGHLIEVQTQIAMDSEKGTKATSAAKFIGKASGLLEEDQEVEQENKSVLGRTLAQKLLSLISKTKTQGE